MKRSRKLLAAISFFLFAFVCVTASGVEVYKWAGSDGVIHYAEAPPESDLSSLEVLDVVVTEPVSPAVADYQSVLDVASSIEASRLERERIRLEREKLLLQERQLQQSQLLAEQYYDHRAGAGVYYTPYYRSRYPLKPYPHHYYGGRHPVPAPHSNRGKPYRGSAPGRVYLNR